jgi:hypothetical protein
MSGNAVVLSARARALTSVIPAKAGIQCLWLFPAARKSLDSRLRGNDGVRNLTPCDHSRPLRPPHALLARRRSRSPVPVTPSLTRTTHPSTPSNHTPELRS